MVLRYIYLKCRPIAFLKLTGMNVSEFDVILDKVQLDYLQAEQIRLGSRTRRRAAGGGDHAELDPRDQLLLTIIWLRLHPHQATLGYFFGISQPTVWRYVQRVQPILEQTGQDWMQVPDLGRRRRRNLKMLLEEIPELLTVVGDFAEICMEQAQ